MHHTSDNQPGPEINPSTGLPLIEDTYIDIGGNPYGRVPTWQPPYSPGSSSIPPPPSSDPW